MMDGLQLLKWISELCSGKTVEVSNCSCFGSCYNKCFQNTSFNFQIDTSITADSKYVYVFSLYMLRVLIERRLSCSSALSKKYECT